MNPIYSKLASKLDVPPGGCQLVHYIASEIDQRFRPPPRDPSAKEKNDGARWTADQFCHALIAMAKVSYPEPQDVLRKWGIRSSKDVGKIAAALQGKKWKCANIEHQEKAYENLFTLEKTPKHYRHGGWYRDPKEEDRQEPVVPLMEKHFGKTGLSNIAIQQRVFPKRMQPDLNRAIMDFFSDKSIFRFSGVSLGFSHEGASFKALLNQDHRNVSRFIPTTYAEVDIGDGQCVQCIENALWLAHDKKSDVRFAVLLGDTGYNGQVPGLRIEFASTGSTDANAFAKSFFDNLQKMIDASPSYRGKILSLEQNESYHGRQVGIQVHALRDVQREQVILPETTLKLLERNVIQFIDQREQLKKSGMATRKGLLFYGPPGTGKTHTLHYLSRALKDHTTFIISAEQVALLSEYMLLARLLQPSIVMIEDVDLIARDRSNMDSPCEEVMLNKLLNEMDGMKTDAEVLFILTTNRPQQLEAALASRPGRVDQAIEFPLPDDIGRKKLIRLYAGTFEQTEETVDFAVRHTDGVSAAFIKELMRRAGQFSIERGGSHTMTEEDIRAAIDEMVVTGGSLNQRILGGAWNENLPG